MRVALLCTLALASLALVAAQSAPGFTPLPFTQAVIMGVSFSDASNGWIAGGDNGVGANALQTADGGNTWTSVPIHQPTMMLLAVQGADSSDAVLAGIGLLSGGTQYLQTGMGSFKNSSMEDLNGNKVSMQQSQDIQYIKGTGGVAVPGSYSFWGSNETINGVAISADGGATFDVINIGGDINNNPPRYSAFPSGKVGFITGGTWPGNNSANAAGRGLTRNIRLVQTEENEIGMNLEWDVLDEELPVEEDDDGWSAAIYRSTDGFATWDVVYTADTFYFNQISCPSEQVCYAVGENDDFGLAFKTNDGGNTWKQILSEASVSMMAAQAISETEVFLGGGIIGQMGVQGQVYHSTDGGNTFNTINAPGYYPTALSMVSSTQGYASAMNSESQCNVLKYGSTAVKPAQKRRTIVRDF